MHLDAATRAQLQGASRDVFLAYARLEITQQEKFTIHCDALGAEAQQLTINELITRLNALPALDQPVALTINGKRCTLRRDPENPKKIEFSFDPALPHPDVKSAADYTLDEKLALLAGGNWRMQIPQKGSQQQLSVILEGENQYELGGPDKIPLYRSHLLTLYKLYERLNTGTEEEINSFLVAMSTGSGKTFVQALWLLVLDQAKVDGVFILPDHLLKQFKDDMPRLLPKALADKLSVFREGEREGLSAKLASMRQEGDRSTTHVLIPQNESLDYHFTALKALNPSRTVVVVDEQHLVMGQESRKLKLMALGEKFLCMFLTATPTKQTYDLCGRDPVCIMSSKQKAAEGQGKFPKLSMHQARDMQDKAKEADVDLGIKRSAVLTQIESLVPNATSPVLSLMEDLRYLPVSQAFHPDPGQTAPQNLAEMQWSYQPPQARKMLAIMNDTNDIINMHRVMTAPDFSPVNYAYQDGALLDREDAYDILGQENVDRHVLSQYRAKKEQEKNEKVAEVATSIQSRDEKEAFERDAKKDLSYQMDHNIFQGMMEYVLSDLTGMSAAEMNVARKQDFPAFMQRVQRALQDKPQRNMEYYKQKLTYDKERNPRGIDSEGARQVAPLLEMLETNLRDFQREEQHLFESAIRNWSVVNMARERIFDRDYIFRPQFNAYAKAHRALYVMQGMDQAETPIKSGKPFWGFDEEQVPIFTADGSTNPKAKIRQRGAYEMLNPQAKETHYRPQYDEALNADMADNYFKLGFVGMYVSNMKTEGFNDRDLHTVLEVVSNEDDPLNDPSKLVQGVGRLRGLDDTQMPYYFMSMQRNCRPGFNLQYLAERDDYYPDYFQAQEHHLNHALQARGKRIANEVFKWIQANRSRGLVIDERRLEQFVYELVLHSFQDLNDQNDHDVEKTRKLFAKVLAVTRDELDKKIKAMEDPNAIDKKAKFIAGVLGSISKFFFNRKLKDVAEVIGLTSDSPDELKLYHRVLTTIDYQELNAQKTLIGGAGTLVEAMFQRVGEAALSEVSDIKRDELMAESMVMIDVMAKWLQPDSLRQEVLANAKYYPHWPAHLAFYGSQLEELASLSEDAHLNPEHAEKLQQIVKGFFAVVPGVSIREENVALNIVSENEKKINGLQTALESAIESGVKEHFAQFLQASFLEHISMLLTEEDAQLVREILANPAHALTFAQALIDNPAQGSEIWDVFIDCFKYINPDVEDIKGLDTRLDSAREALIEATSDLEALFEGGEEETQEQATVRTNALIVTFLHELLPARLKVASAQQLKQSFQQHLLPVLVKNFNPAVQAEIFEACDKDPDFGRRLMSCMLDPKFSALFISLKSADEEEIRQLFANPELNELLVQLFTYEPELSADLLHGNWRNFVQVAQAAGTTIQQDIERLTDPDQALSGVGDYFSIGLSALTKGGFKAAMKERIASNLALYFSKQFLENIEPLFTGQDHIFLSTLLRNPKNARIFADAIIAKGEAGELEEFNFEIAMQLLQDTFPERFKFYSVMPIITRLESGVEEFSNVAQAQTENLDDHLEEPAQLIILRGLMPQHKQAINEIVHTQYLPLVLKYFAPEHHAAIREAWIEYDNWPYLFAKHKESLESLNESVDLENLTREEAQAQDAKVRSALLGLIHDIPGLEKQVADPDRGLFTSAVNLRTVSEIQSLQMEQFNRRGVVIDKVADVILKQMVPFFDAAFPTNQAQALRQLFSKPKHAAEFAQMLLEVIKASPDQIEPEDIIKCLQHYADEKKLEIGKLAAGPEAMQQAAERMKKIFDAALPNVSLNKLLRDHVLPQFTRKASRDYIHFMVGKFSEKELALYIFQHSLAENRGADAKSPEVLEQEAEKIAHQLKRMDELLRKKDYRAFANEFLNIPPAQVTSAEDVEKNIRKLPITSLMTLLYELQKDMIEVHNYHYQYSPGGQSSKPKLLGPLQPGRDQIPADLLAYMFIESTVSGAVQAKPVMAALRQPEREAMRFVNEGTIAVLAGKLDQNGLSVWLHTQGKALQNGLLDIFRSIRSLFSSRNTNHLLDLGRGGPTEAERLEAAQTRAEKVAEDLRQVQGLEAEQLGDQGATHATKEVHRQVLNPARTPFGLFHPPHVPASKPSPKPEVLPPPPGPEAPDGK